MLSSVFGSLSQRLSLRAIFNLVLFSTSLATATAVWGTTEVGAIPGSFAVSSTGAATYSIPISVPPGTGGLAPHLALTYSSQGGNGLAGWGWNLSGLSSITVCPKTFDQDGVNQGISFAGTDAGANDFCLDGSKLFVNSGSYGGNASFYHKEIDDFSRAEAFTSGGAGTVPTKGPQYFRVQTGDGLTYEYGYTSDSRSFATGDIPAGVNVVRVWALDKISDAYGNSVDFVYAHSANGSDYWPTSITWANHNGSGGLHSLTFTYDLLSSVGSGLTRTSFLAGATISATRRLKEIDVVYNTITDFTYTLSYGTTLLDANSNTGTERSRLQSITECAGTICYPPTTIGWQDGTSGWNAAVDTGITAPNGNGGNAAATRMIDVDGDGLSDIVYPGQSGNWKILFANGNGFSAPFVTSATVNTSTMAESLPINLYLGAHTGLLVPDSAGYWMYLTPEQNASSPGGYDLVPHYVTDSQGNLMPATGADTGNANAEDIDGDGHTDIVFNDGTDMKWYRYQSSGHFYPAAVLLAGANLNLGRYMTRSFSVSRPDFDGDGMADWVSFTQYPGCQNQYCNPTWTMEVGGDSPTTYSTISASIQSNTTAPVLVSFNGDGLSDALYADGTSTDQSTWTWRLYTSDGVGMTGVNTGITLRPTMFDDDPVIVDYSGNGRMELMGTSGTPGNCSQPWRLLGYAAGSFQELSTGGVSGVCGTGYLSNTLRTADINGDGLQDLVWIANGTWHYRLHSGLKPDLVTSIDNGYSQHFSINYASLTDGASYTKGSSGVFPVVDYLGSMYVVTQYSGNDGIGGQYIDSYTYAGAQTDVHGRGFLGFSQVNVTDSHSGMPISETDTSYSLQFPYIGAITAITQKVGTSVVHTLANTFLSLGALTQTTNNSGSNSVFAQPPASTSWDCELGHTTCDDTDFYRKSAVSAPTLTWSTNSANSLPQSYTTTVTVNPGNFVTTTETDYQVDRADWCSTLPSGTIVTRSSNASPTALSRTVSYTNSVTTCRRSTASATETATGQTLTTAYNFDSTYGNLQSASVTGTDPVTGTKTRTVNYGYDSATNTFVTSLTNDLNEVTALQWDPTLGARLSVTDPNGAGASWTYDALGLMTGNTRPDGTSSQLVYTLCSTNCGVTNGKYQVVATHNSANSVAGATATVVYDAFGRALLQSTYLLGDTLDYVQTAYDSLGRVTAESNPYTSTPSAWTYTDYDDASRPLHTYAPAGQDSGCGGTYNSETVCTTAYAYSGLTNTVTNAKSQQSSTTLDALGEVTSVTDAAGGVTSYLYDVFGDLTQTTDAAYHQTAIAYDSWGRKTSMTDPSLGVWSYTYTPFGELATQTDAKSQVITQTYDVLGRIATRTKPLVGGGTGTDTWTYDGPSGTPTSGYIGKLYQLTGADGYSRGYQYDASGRPSEVDTTIDGTTYATSTGYDSFGHVASITYPSTPTGTPDSPPVADAGTGPININLGQSVMVDGSGSNDNVDTGPESLTYRWTQVSGPALDMTVDGATTAQVTSTPSAAGAYTFMLTVSDGELTSSDTVTVNVIPPVPTGLTASTPSQTTGNFNLTWTGASGDSTYQIEEAINGGSFTPLPGTYTSPAPLSRTDGSYQYAVQGCAGSICSDWSTPPITVTELLTPGIPVQSAISPNPSTTGNYTVSWSQPSGTVTYYKLYSSTDGGSTYDGGTNVGNVLSWSPTSAKRNGTYTYKVAACNSPNGSCGSTSNVKSVTVNRPVPAAPSASISPETDGSADVSWTPNGSVTATSWDLDRSLALSFNPDTITSLPASPHTKNVDPNVTTHYRIRGCNAAGCGSWSNTVTDTVTFGGGGSLNGDHGAGLPSIDAIDGSSLVAMAGVLAPRSEGSVVAIAGAAMRSPAAETQPPSSTLAQLRHEAIQTLAIRPRPLPVPAKVRDRQLDLGGRQSAAVFAALRVEPDGTLTSGVPVSLLSSKSVTRMHLVTGPTYSRYEVAYSYDDHENLTQVADAVNPSLVYWQAQQVNNFGEVVSEILGNGVINTRAFDANTGALTVEQSGLGNSTSLANRSYAWDAIGNLSSRSDANHGWTESFSYDSLNRLTGATMSGGNSAVAALSVSYDAVGNILSKSDVGTYTYGDGSHAYRLTKITPTTGPAQNLSYDANGNITADATRSYDKWDADNRPVHIYNASTDTTFSYTPDGARYKEVTGQGSVTTTFTEVNPLFQVTFDGTTTNFKEMITAGGTAVAQRTIRQDGLLTTRYLGYDHLGNVRTITKEDGSLVCEMSYDAFGNLRDPDTGVKTGAASCSGQVGIEDITDKGYTNQQQLTGLGLIHMNGRVYDPVIGRMISADPTIPNPFFSQAFNRYAYAMNNPLNTTDPTGFAPNQQQGPVGQLPGLSGTYELAGVVGNGNYQSPFVGQPMQLGTVEVFGFRQISSLPDIPPPNLQPVTPPPDPSTNDSGQSNNDNNNNSQNNGQGQSDQGSTGSSGSGKGSTGGGGNSGSAPQPGDGSWPGQNGNESKQDDHRDAGEGFTSGWGPPSESNPGPGSPCMCFSPKKEDGAGGGGPNPPDNHDPNGGHQNPARNPPNPLGNSPVVPPGPGNQHWPDLNPTPPPLVQHILEDSAGGAIAGTVTGGVGGFALAITESQEALAAGQSTAALFIAADAGGGAVIAGAVAGAALAGTVAALYGAALYGAWQLGDWIGQNIPIPDPVASGKGGGGP